MTWASTAGVCRPSRIGGGSRIRAVDSHQLRLFAHRVVPRAFKLEPNRPAPYSVSAEVRIKITGFIFIRRGTQNQGRGTDSFPYSPEWRPIRLACNSRSCYDHAMKAYICEVDETGLRRLLPEDVLAGDVARFYTRHRLERPTTVAWTLLDDGDAESIRSEVAAGHHNAACGLLLNRAIELLPITAVIPGPTLA